MRWSTRTRIGWAERCEPFDERVFRFELYPALAYSGYVELGHLLVPSLDAHLILPRLQFTDSGLSIVFMINFLC